MRYCLLILITISPVFTLLALPVTLPTSPLYLASTYGPPASTTSAPGCPIGYTLGTDGSNKCYKVYPNQFNRSTAAKRCYADGGQLASIPNAFTNTLIVTEAQTFGTQVWTGLTCYNSINGTYCLWDDGSGPNVYSNFYSGYPNVNIGQCVVMTSNGRWISADCNDFTAGFACEYFLGNSTQGSVCGGKYTLFNGMCYQFYNDGALGLGDPESYCQANGGHLISIHSKEENDYVLSLANTTVFRSRLLIGLSGKLTWTDNSPFNYNNIGYNNTNEGFCYAMTVSQSDFIAEGKWLSVPCDRSTLPYVCKRPIGAAVIPLAPALCPLEAARYTNNGTLYSPSFPSSYQKQQNVCQYLITVDSGNAGIHFTDFVLDKGSSMEFYNQPSDAQPFYTLTGTNGLNQDVVSTYETLLIIFLTNGAPNDGKTYNWAGYFGKMRLG